MRPDAKGGRRPHSARSISTRRCCAIWMRWSSRPAPGDPDSPLTVDVPEPALDVGGGGRSGPPRQPHGRSPSCCTDWATACRATPRLVRAATHVDRDAQFRYIARLRATSRNGNSSRRFRWTPRRRSWSARSRTRAAPGARRRRRERRTGPRLRDPGHRHHGREGHSVWHLRICIATKAG